MVLHFLANCPNYPFRAVRFLRVALKKVPYRRVLALFCYLGQLGQFKFLLDIYMCNYMFKHTFYTCVQNVYMSCPSCPKCLLCSLNSILNNFYTPYYIL